MNYSLGLEIQLMRDVCQVQILICQLNIIDLLKKSFFNLLITRLRIVKLIISLNRKPSSLLVGFFVLLSLLKQQMVPQINTLLTHYINLNLFLQPILVSKKFVYHLLNKLIR